MEIAELYAQYGELMIQKEVLDARVLNAKKAIVEALNALTPLVGTTNV